MEIEVIFKKRFRVREDQPPDRVAHGYADPIGLDVVSAVLLYDPTFGDDILCECGHAYYRHFDTYDNMAPVGCKYCHNFVEGISHRPEQRPPESLDEDVIDWTKYASICSGFKRAKTL